MSETRSLADTKAHLSEMVEFVAREHQRIYITKRGKTVAVLMSADELEGLEETMDILATPGALEEIRKAEADAARGDYMDAAEVRAKYLKGK